jgi:predicted acylesterase/phospholipase RssA
MKLKKLTLVVISCFMAIASKTAGSVEQELEELEGQQKYNCFSGDGGGMRGYASLLMLQALENEMRSLTGNSEEKLWDYFDFYGGTSTGGIIAAGAALGESIPKMLKLYRDKGLFIFPESSWDAIKTGGGLTSSRYKLDGLEKTLKEIHPTNPWLSNSCKPLLLTGYRISPIYDVRQGMRKIHDESVNQIYNFTSYAAQASEDDDFPLWQACCATAAAPPYLPAFEVCSKTNRRMIVFDGGMHSPNPSSIILEEAKSMFKAKKSQINIFSFSTGFMNFAPTFSTYGMAELHLNGMLDRNLTAQGQAIDESMKKRLDKQYFRFNPPLQESILFVDGRPATLERLKNYTDAYLALPATQAEIRRAAEVLVESKNNRFQAL